MAGEAAGILISHKPRYQPVGQKLPPEAIERRPWMCVFHNEPGGPRLFVAFGGIAVELARADGTDIDEDFSDDAEWESFCCEMAKQLDVRYFSVPYFYYPK